MGGFEFVIWYLWWLPVSFFGSIAAISGLVLVKKRSIQGGLRLFTLTISWLAIILNFTIVAYILFSMLFVY